VSRYIDEHRGRFGVEPICGVLGVSASAYYQRASGERCARAVEDARLLELIRELHAANYYAYGYRRMWKATRARRRAGPALPRAAAHARARDRRGQAAWPAVADHPPRPAGAAPARSRPAQFQRLSAG
jgi:hypothetical protein